MSSTYVADTSDEHKADNTLIIIVNNDGTVSVDQETLQNLLANQHNTPVSLVRLSGHSHGDDSSQDSNGTCDSQNDGNPHVNLTVEGYYPPAALPPTPEVPVPVAVPAEPPPLVEPEPEPDPFLEMDSEQLKRLETALQSEQAKQILGENVTAMLDMLSVDEESSLFNTIHEDHCYTTLTPASAPPTPPPASSSDRDYNAGEGTSQQTTRGRGRGRGPGRPRKDAGVARGAATSAQRGAPLAGRGMVGRGGTVRVQRGGTSNVVMVQQLKSITPLAPPPNSPSSASLVPLIRPLEKMWTIAQNKVVTVPVSAGATRFVTVSGKPFQVLDANGQQSVYVTTAPTPVQVQPASSASQVKPAQDSCPPVIVSQPKVVVTKIPAISPQLVSVPSQEQRLDKGDEAEFTNYPAGAHSESEEVSEEDCGDTDTDYKESSNRRRSNRGGARTRGGRFQRGGRGKGRGRPLELSRPMFRGTKLRGGRGRGVVRPEEAERAQKLEMEMAAALQAMDTSPSKETVTKPKEEVEEKAEEPVDSSGKKKTVKKVSEELPMVTSAGETEEDERTHPLQSVEKKSPAAKSPVRKLSADPTSPVTPVPTITPTTPPGSDVGKKYPKRENRKPPAHLADAFGPALFSTPDIIRRVSTGGETKAPSPGDEAKKASPEVKSPAVDLPASPPAALKEEQPAELVQQEETDPGPQPELKEPTQEEQTADMAMDVDIPASEPVEAVTSTVPSAPSPVKVEVVPEPVVTPAKPAAATPTATRASRRRTPAVCQSPEPVSRGKQVAAAQMKEKKKQDEARAKTARRQSSEVEPEDEDGDSSGDDSVNSEDDPNRLWCICKKPHNNRFMICCDACEDWFHGKCVGITKAMGQQMENKGIEWVCPNCTKKREGEVKEEKKPKKIGKDMKQDSAMEVDSTTAATSPVDKAAEALAITEAVLASTVDNRMFCIVCKKEARQSSIYCSDSCILKHAQDSLTVPKEKPLAAKPQESAAKPGELAKTRPDARVVVLDKKTGKLLAGSNAPTAAGLKTWLKENPTFQVVKPGLAASSKSQTVQVTGTGPAKVLATQAKIVPLIQTKLAVSQQKTILIDPKPLPAPPKPVALPPKLTSAQPKPSTAASVPAKPAPAAPSKPPAATPAKTSAPSKVLPAKPAAAATPSKPLPAKLQKVVVSSTSKESPKVAPKSPVKTPVTSTKPVVVKPSGSAGAVTKGPAQTSVGKVTPTVVVSKVPATSTVKEPPASKQSAEKIIVKKVELKRPSSEAAKKEDDKDKPSGPEPIRVNVRKTLQELLLARIQECPDLNVSENTVQDIALKIEEEMHTFFRDTGIKYKSKYRSLVFNIKDPKNLTLFRKIADNSVTPHQLVRLSPEELASQELAQWRAQEAKHQLEMIKKNELEMMSQAKTYVMKTHKGEQVIETDESLKVEVPELVDPSAVPDLASPPNNSVSSTVEDSQLDKGKSKVSKDKGKEKSKHEDKKKGKEKGDKSKKESRRRDSHGHHHHERRHREKSRDRHRSRRDSEKHKDKKEEEEVKKEEIVVKKESTKDDAIDSCKTEVKESVKKSEAQESIQFEPIEIKTELQDVSDSSDHEPSSTVTIKTPEINVDYGVEDDPTREIVWRGIVNMPDVSRFYTIVHVVSGDPSTIGMELPTNVDIVGRIAPETVWDYISKMKKTGTKEIVVIRFTAANEGEKIPYITLYTYLSSRSRLGVIGNNSRGIKDFYIMPLAAHSPVPQVLLPLDGPGFEDFRPHLLLGIIVRARRKRLAPENEYVAKLPKHIPPASETEGKERSYTPPLPDAAGSLTPPHPPPTTPGSYTPPHSPQQFFGGPQLPLVESMVTGTDPDSIDAESTNQDKSSVEGRFSDDDIDDETPYSPGGSDLGESSEDNLLLTPKNSTDLQRKVDELNRKIEEQKQQIQCISSAMVCTDSFTGVEPLQVNMMQSFMMPATVEPRQADEGDENEAYSPSRSFTPPQPSLSFMSLANTSTVLPSIPTDISLPSNIHEILASIKKRESDSKGINLKADPIVQTYGNEDLEQSNDDSYEPSAAPYNEEIVEPDVSPPGVSTTTSLQSASSALLSLATPVVHTVGPLRDPRQRGSSTPDSTKASAGSTLSSLSDDDLIKKAAEMEMDYGDSPASDSTDAGAAPVVPLPLSSLPPPPPPPPPLPPKTSLALPLQPLPPGVEDEEYPAYSSASYVPPPPGVEEEEYASYNPSYVPPSAARSTPPLPHIAPPPVNYSTPPPFSIPHHFTPPPTFSTPPPPPPPPIAVPPSAGYTSSLPVYPGPSEEPSGTSSMKRKYMESEMDDEVKRDCIESPGREPWDNKVPVPVRNRFSSRGRHFLRSGGNPHNHRGFRNRQHRPRWQGKSHYDAGIRSEWDLHIKKFEEKHRERTREQRLRDRRSHSTRSGKRRDSDSAGDSSP